MRAPFWREKCSAVGMIAVSCKENESPFVKDTKKRKTPQVPRGQSQSCHQCRQSIHSLKGAIELKTGQQRIKCSQCTRYWCEKCLDNRYGITRLTLDITNWFCPVCSRNCNCSLCRRKTGKLATGILTPLAKNAGFSNVSDFLHEGTDDVAKCLQWQSPIIDSKVSSSSSSSSAKNKKKLSPFSKDTTFIPTSPSPKRLKIHHTDHTLDENTFNRQVNQQPHHAHSEATPTRCLRNRSIVVPVDVPKVQSTVARKPRRTPKVVIVKMIPDERVLHTLIAKQDELTKEKRKIVTQLNETTTRERQQVKIKKDTQKRMMLKDEIAKRKEERQLKQDKIRKAKQILQDTHRQSEIQRHRQVEELKQLMRKRKLEERHKTQLVLRPLSIPQLVVVQEQPVSPLPPYPSLRVGVSDKYVPSLLFVSEFLSSFSEVLGINKMATIDSVCAGLSKRTTSGRVFKCLLSLLSTDDDNITAGFYKGLTDATAEECTRKWITSCNPCVNGMDGVVLSCDFLEVRLELLSHLCSSALSCDQVSHTIKQNIENFKQQKKDFRNLQSGITQKSRDTLKSMSECGATLEELSVKREEFINNLQKHQKTYPVCGSFIRQEPLGTDRHERLYWSLGTVPEGILVEDTEQGVWSILDSPQLIEQVLNSLDLSNSEELELHVNLSKHSSTTH